MGNITKEELHLSLVGELEGKLDKTAVELLPSSDIILTVPNKEVVTDFPSLGQIKLITGKTVVNYIPPFNSSAWTLTDADLIAPNEISIKPKTTGDVSIGSPHIYLKPLTTYTFTFEGDVKIGIAEYSAGPLQIAYYDAANGKVTFTTKDNSLFVRLWLSKPATGTYTAKSLSLTLGDTVQPYVTNFKGIMNPTVVNKTNGTRVTAITTLYEGESLTLNKDLTLTKTQDIQEVTLNPVNDSLTYELYHAQPVPGGKLISIRGLAKYMFLGEPRADTVKAFSKFDGMLLKEGGHTTDVNRYGMWLEQDQLYVSVDNNDSGWGPSYSPTADEIRAYFLGWRMTDANWAIYNGTGDKFWGYRLADPKGGNNGYQGGFTTVPTLQAITHARWQPYRILFKKTRTVNQIVPTSGSLVLDKGSNTLEIMAGEIVQEHTVPAFSSTHNTYEINSLTFSTVVGNPLKYAADLGLRVYRNGVLDLKWLPSYTQNGSTNGRERRYIEADNFDPSAVYTVDYKPLYLYEVTVPVDSITINHSSNMGSVVEDLVDTTAQLAVRTGLLEQSTVKKNQAIRWLAPTLFGGAVITDSNSCRVGKDALNNVFLRLRFIHNSAVANTVVAKLPEGYRPKYTLAIQATVTNDGSNFYLYILPSGDVTVGKAALNGKTLAVNVSYNTEQ